MERARSTASFTLSNHASDTYGTFNPNRPWMNMLRIPFAWYSRSCHSISCLSIWPFQNQNGMMPISSGGRVKFSRVSVTPC